MVDSSRIPGFYNLSLEQRREQVSRRTQVALDHLSEVLECGGLNVSVADKVVENVLGVYGLPFGITLNLRMNGRDYLAPMVVEEPSVIAAASNAARMMRGAGGFSAQMVEDLMTTQVQLYDVPEPRVAIAALEAASDELLQLAAASVPNLLARGGGPKALEARDLGDGMLVLHLHVDCRDAMGANLVNTIAEAVGPRAAAIARSKLGLRILTNLCDRRRVRVEGRVHAQDLVMGRPTSGAASWAPEARSQGEEVIEAIVQASRFAEVDPYRAATHNKGIMNGIDSVVIATGNDYRAVEAGAHAFAARSGRYRPLATWHKEGAELVGVLELPLALGIVGGTLRVHPAAQLALKLAQVNTASELSQLAACVGLASNLAAIRALATAGIQQGHMALHARSVAIAAGAEGDEVEAVSQRIFTDRTITVEAALETLTTLRAEQGDSESD